MWIKTIIYRFISKFYIFVIIILKFENHLQKTFIKIEINNFLNVSTDLKIHQNIYFASEFELFA